MYPNSYTFLLSPLETFGRLGELAMELVNKLFATATAGGVIDKGACMARAWMNWVSERATVMASNVFVALDVPLLFELVLVGVHSWQEQLFQLQMLPKGCFICFLTVRLLLNTDSSFIILSLLWHILSSSGGCGRRRSSWQRHLVTTSFVGRNAFFQLQTFLQCCFDCLSSARLVFVTYCSLIPFSILYNMHTHTHTLILVFLSFL